MKNKLATFAFYLSFVIVCVINIFYFAFYMGWKLLAQMLLNEYRRYISLLPQWARALIMKPDLFGLYHNFKYLDTINHQIKVWPIEQQVLYADHVTRRQVLDKTIKVNECLEQLREFKAEPSLMQNVNATSIGNIAFIAAHCEDKTLAVVAHKTLNKIREAYAG